MKPSLKVITIVLLDFLVPHDATTVKTENATEAFQCGIYMAASSIPNAGFGVYTTRSISEGETAQPSAESPLIPLYDWDDDENVMGFRSTMNNYIWGANDMASLEADTSGYENSMSLGALCNFHTVSYRMDYNDVCKSYVNHMYLIQYSNMKTTLIMAAHCYELLLINSIDN